MFQKYQHQKSPAMETKQSGPNNIRHWPLWLVIVIILLASLLMTAVLWYFSGRALPNVTVGNTTVGLKTPADIQKLVAAQQSALSVTFNDSSESMTVPVKDLGVSIDVAATVTAVTKAGRNTSNLLRDLEFWNPIHIPLVFSNDPGVIKEFVQQHFPSIFVEAKDAQLSYNMATNQYDVIPGTLGKGFDITKFETSLPSLALRPRNISLTLATTPVQPFIQPAGLVNVQKDINQKIQTAIVFTLNGKTVYKSKPADIAGWTDFSPDTVKGTSTIDFDKAKIQQFITQTISPTIASPPIDRKVIIDTQSNAQTVLDAGQQGQQLADIDTLTGQVYDALTANKSLTQEVSIAQAPFKTITLSGSGKWIEVDLTRQTATLYIGSTPIQTFLISSGTAATPTEVGTFAVWHKTPMQTMTESANGVYYYIPNIPWVSYFDGGEAFHGTYWHHNFGHPMSHGCINMTIPDAKIVYDFAPVGTKVVVHN